ncbi:hypothetical protein LTR85_002976 [Meristemomyces frigidus]|nr:hypothetical protein LTR85_002976 [Meristemomyces frigidus]
MLVAIVLLAVYDLVRPSGIPNGLMHLSAIGILLIAHPSVLQSSEIARSLLFTLSECTFGLPCVMGVASPFENIGTEAAASSDAVCQSSPFDSLQVAGYTMHTLLPRLIIEVRRIRSGQDTASAESAIKLAEVLLKAENEGAESVMLHRIHVTETEDCHDRPVVKWSFKFSSISDMGVAVSYWTARLLVIRLCLILETFCPAFSSSITRSSLEADQERLATNILMSWQYAHAHGFFALRYMREALFATWGALTDRTMLRGTPVSTVRDWILTKSRDSLSEWNWLHRTAMDMDEASDVFAGGALAKLFVPLAPSVERMLWRSIPERDQQEVF